MDPERVGRVLAEAADWLADLGPELTSLRSFVGPNDKQGYFAWKDKGGPVVRRAKFGSGARPWDHRNTESQLLAIQARAYEGCPIDGVIILRDIDRLTNQERVESIRAALSEFSDKAADRAPWARSVALGAPVPKLEAWHLLGFRPESPEEHEALAKVRQELGFLPHEQPERLFGGRHNPDAPHSADKVLDRLTGADPVRHGRCLAEPPLGELRQRGGPSGLTDFLDELSARIVPLFTGRHPHG